MELTALDNCPLEFNKKQYLEIKKKLFKLLIIFLPSVIHFIL